MRFKFPENDAKYYWTDHVKRKMVFYGLSADRIKRAIRNPKRVEDGVVENTVAVMFPAGSKQKPTEIWVMYSFSKKASALSEKSESKDMPFNTFSKFSAGKLGTINSGANKKIIISAWRYPGVSPTNKPVPIPDDVLEEINRELELRV